MKRSGIRLKQRKAARLFSLEGYNKKDALREAGYSPSYIRSCTTQVFNDPEVVKYLDELEERKEEAAMQLWSRMLLDAPDIYKKYRELANKTDSDDVKRRIYSDILDRTGFKQANKIDINDNKRIVNVDEAIEKEIKDMKDLGIDIGNIINAEE